MSGSVVYTIGTALNRALDHGVPVQVLVEGAWLAGTVLAVDGYGVVISGDEQEHAVIRIEAVSAVRILSQAPARIALPGGARTMPSSASA